MKYIVRITILCIAAFCLTSMSLKENDFHVIIEQDGKIIESNNGVVTLDKRPFTFVFEFNEPMGLLVNGSFEETTYKLATRGGKRSKLPGFQNTGMAEGLLNPEKEILISNESPSYWFYDDSENHRFNSIETVDGKLLCRRIIENLYNVDAQTNIKVENVSKPLYVTFISYKESQEIKREWIKIEWKE